MENKIVMSDSPDAAQYRTDLKGWVSRDGFYFGDGTQGERAARYAGCTHVPCSQCGAQTPRGYTMCRACRDVASIAKYEAMPRAEWDGKAMIYSEARDRYYNSPDDAADDLEDGETLADLRLVICTPNYVCHIEPDYCCADLPEDGDVPAEVEEAMAAFNEAVAGIVLSWSPGKVALALPEGHNASFSGGPSGPSAASDSCTSKVEAESE